MTAETGRIAIENYWLANWTDCDTVGLGGTPATITAPCARLTIRHGSALTRSTGRAVAMQNVIAYVGTLTISIYTDGSLGDAPANAMADAVMDLFHAKTLDALGAIVDDPAQTAHVRFSPPELAGSENPYIGAQFDNPPFRQTNVICPFVRYEIR